MGIRSAIVIAFSLLLPGVSPGQGVSVKQVAPGVFFRQGAYAEAEKEFRNAERKDDKNIEYIFSTAYNYLKLHKPDDAFKRYERTYKKESDQPARARRSRCDPSVDAKATSVNACRRSVRVSLLVRT
jgi:tetratricopeptide (TPR) repeat protein